MNVIQESIELAAKTPEISIPLPMELPTSLNTDSAQESPTVLAVYRYSHEREKVFVYKFAGVRIRGT